MNSSKNKKNPKKLALSLNTNKVSSFVVPPPPPTNSSMHYYRQGPACILPNLYLGAYYNALNTLQLSQLNIGCVINVASEIHITPNVEYHHLRWSHSQKNLAVAEFSHAIKLIQIAHQQRKIVLVHCQQGIERSAALVLAYLLSITHQPFTANQDPLAGQKWSLDRAFQYVQERAPGIRPNLELLYQLKEYEKGFEPYSPKSNRRQRSESVNDSCQNKRSPRPRSASFRDTTTSFDAILEKKLEKNVLATTSLLIVLAATALQYQGDQGSFFFHHHPHPVFFSSISLK